MFLFIIRTVFNLISDTFMEVFFRRRLEVTPFEGELTNVKRFISLFLVIGMLLVSYHVLLSTYHLALTVVRQNAIISSLTKQLDTCTTYTIPLKK